MSAGRWVCALILYPILTPSLISHMVSVDVKHHERGRTSAGRGAGTDWPRQKHGRQRHKSGHTSAESGFQARSKDLEILEEGGGAGPSTMPRRDRE